MSYPIDRIKFKHSEAIASADKDAMAQFTHGKITFQMLCRYVAWNNQTTVTPLQMVTELKLLGYGDYFKLL